MAVMAYKDITTPQIILVKLFQLVGLVLNVVVFTISIAQPSINQACIKNLKIPLPPLETQRQIVEIFDRQMQALEGVRLLKEEAQKRTEEVLTDVWGEE